MSNHIDFIAAFFAEYPSFRYKVTATTTSEFYRMCDFFGWDKEDQEREDAREKFHDAMTQQFNGIYGTSVDDLGSWQNLCRVLRITPVSNKLLECRDVSYAVIHSLHTIQYILSRRCNKRM